MAGMVRGCHHDASCLIKNGCKIELQFVERSCVTIKPSGVVRMPVGLANVTNLDFAIPLKRAGGISAVLSRAPFRSLPQIPYSRLNEGQIYVTIEWSPRYSANRFFIVMFRTGKNSR